MPPADIKFNPSFWNNVIDKQKGFHKVQFAKAFIVILPYDSQLRYNQPRQINVVIEYFPLEIYQLHVLPDDLRG